jgi:hypothetical protein
LILLECIERELGLSCLPLDLLQELRIFTGPNLRRFPTRLWSQFHNMFQPPQV